MITKEDVEHIGWLARIEISEQEKAEYMEKLNSVLDYFGQLDEVSTEDVPPTYHVIDLHDVFREDVAKESLSQEEVLANTEHTQEGAFRVPKIG
ncbi:MAG: Asp-tRNA(Asn)/Glu-tRNA(Gln) amidotransferase subunit GatC [Methanosarcinaceae archaeon]|nr:Asp-tRNA(Asn)/Glu-tRNA(Gln) amidotransferase subunit GatC [Methanosarcinaceae archaeon]MDD4497213.1 Asp-tRNA(Asn)/Glu-tRNA(Gln) amidotransferase subunit GatC [Methanosarcinaceae archaeon]